MNISAVSEETSAASEEVQNMVDLQLKALEDLSEASTVLNDEARKLQNEANRMIAILCKIGVMQAEKEIMNQLGFDFGDCLPPFSKISEENKALIAKEIIPYIEKA